MGKSKYTYKDIYNGITTEEEAYWLGFITADGYVGISAKEKSITVKLAIKDASHLEKLARFTTEDRSPRLVKTADGRGRCVYTIGSYEIVDRMQSLGLLPGKYNRHVPSMRDDLVRHFIRGYFDGDGCITYDNRYENSVRVSLCVHDSYAESMIVAIESVCGIKPKVYTKKNVVELSIQSRLEAICFLQALYENSSVYLERKYNKYKEALARGDTSANIG